MPNRRVLCALPVLAFALGCSSSSDDQTHGPVVDAGNDTATDYPPDGAPDVGHLEASSKDSPTTHKESGADARGEGSVPESGSSDAATDGSTPLCAGMKGTIVLAGGSSSVGFGASSVNGGAWAVTSLTTTSSPSNPALAPLGANYLALFTAASTNTLQYSLDAAAKWSPGANATAKSCSGPAMALGSAGIAAIGATMHSVYLGMDSKYYHGTYSGGAWDCESDPVTYDGVQSFGPSAPAVASVGSSLVAAYDGNDHNLYAQPWTGGAWGAAVPIVTDGSVGTTPPTLIAMTGGSSDLLVVYEQSSGGFLYWSVRTGGTWSSPAATNATAYSTEPVSLAPMTAGAAVLAFEGTDMNAYGMTFDPSSGKWSAPAALLAGGQALTAPPTVAAGVCGADAIAAVMQPGGVDLVPLTASTDGGGGWSTTPYLVTGAAALTSVSIVTTK